MLATPMMLMPNGRLRGGAIIFKIPIIYLIQGLTSARP